MLGGQRWWLDSGFPNSDCPLPTSWYTLWTSALPAPRSARCASRCSLAAKSLSNAGTLGLAAWLCGRSKSRPEKFRSVSNLWGETLNSGALIWMRSAQESGLPNRNADPRSRFRTTGENVRAVCNRAFFEPANPAILTLQRRCLCPFLASKFSAACCF